MDSLVTRAVIALAANAVALLLAALLLDGVRVKPLFFLLLVAVFTVISLLVTPTLTAFVKENAAPIASLAGLIAAFVALVITVLVSDSLRVTGLVSWVMATLIMWVAALIVQYISPLVVREREERRQQRGQPPA